MKIARTRLGIASVFSACLLAVLIALASADAASAQSQVYWDFLLNTGIGKIFGSRCECVMEPPTYGSQPIGVAVDSEHVWLGLDNGSTIGRMNLDGTNFVWEFIKLPAEANPVALAVDRHHVYWADYREGSIGRANLDGTDVEPYFIGTGGSPYGVAVNREHIYWTSVSRQSIGRANLDGTSVNDEFIKLPTKYPEEPDPYRLAVNDAHIYWANHNLNTIGRANLDGTGLNNKFITLIGGIAPGGVALDAEHLYVSFTALAGGTEIAWLSKYTLEGMESTGGWLRGSEPGTRGRSVAVTTEAPAVETKPATAVKPTSATLNGSVNPNGREPSECTIEYGKTTAYGSSVPCAPMPGTGGAPVAVSASVTGLVASTEYHFRVTAASISGSRSGADQTFTTPGKIAQSISFTSFAPIDATVGGAAYEVAAEAGSELPVSFTIDGTSSSVCAISGSRVSFIGAGTCTVDANQPGNGEYEPAPQTQQAFQVAKGAQTITFTSSPPKPADVGGAPYSVSAEVGSGLPVSFSIDGTSSSVCAIAGSNVSFRAAGTCTIDANQAGDGDYEAAPQAQQTFSVVIPPTVTKVAPKKGPAGTNVTVKGTNLTGATAVYFGSVSAVSYTVSSAKSLVAVSPAQSAGPVDVTVSTPNGTSAASSKDLFSVTPTVTVTGVSPGEGPTSGGSEVTVTGSGFVTGSTGTAFKFGAKVKSVTCTTTTSCTVITPKHAAGTVDVTATVDKVTSAKSPADRYNYL